MTSMTAGGARRSKRSGRNKNSARAPGAPGNLANGVIPQLAESASPSCVVDGLCWLCWLKESVGGRAFKRYQNGRNWTRIGAALCTYCCDVHHIYTGGTLNFY
jgi:hypothetical protein